jgi:hypothetical protein
MPLTYMLFPDLAVALVRYRGDLTATDVIASYEDFVKDPETTPLYSYLLDLSHLSMLEMDFEKMSTLSAKLAEMYAYRAPTSITAAYAPTDYGFGVARMYKSLSEDSAAPPFYVYRHLDTACAALGITSPADLERLRAELRQPDTARQI